MEILLCTVVEGRHLLHELLSVVYSLAYDSVSVYQKEYLAA